VVICLERGANDLQLTLLPPRHFLFIKIYTRLTFLFHPGLRSLSWEKGR